VSKPSRTIMRRLVKHFANDPQVTVKSVEHRRSGHHLVKIDVRLNQDTARFVITQGGTPNGPTTMEQSITKNLRMLLRQHIANHKGDNNDNNEVQ